MQDLSKKSQFFRIDRFHLLSEAIERISDYAIFMLDPQGHILTWNLGAKNIKGYTEEEVVGKHFSIFYPQKDRDRKYPEYELEQAAKVGRFEDEGWRVRKDGKQFWANVVITKINDSEGNLLGFSKVTRDLTERKKAEERLRVSEERFRLLTEAVVDYAIFMLDPKGNISSWNEGAHRLKQYEKTEILGKHFSIFYRPEDIHSGKCEYELTQAKKIGRFEDNGWRIRKDGSKFWANVIITKIIDSAGNHIGFSKVTRDLTEKILAENKIKQSYNEMEKMVVDRTLALASANQKLQSREEELEQSIKARDEFLYVASHELKTPVTALKMQTQILLKKLGSNATQQISDDKLRSSLLNSTRQIDRLTSLVEDLLDVARAQEQKFTFKFEDVDLVALVKDVLRRMEDQLDVAKCTVQTDFPEKILFHADQFRIEQVIVNFFSNVIKYAPGSPVLVSIETRDNRVLLVISDGGPGIPAKYHSKIFERFERATNSRNISGLGLGLYISKQIVESHGGTIGVVSQSGKGAAFVVELPYNTEN